MGRVIGRTIAEKLGNAIAITVSRSSIGNKRICSVGKLKLITLTISIIIRV